MKNLNYLNKYRIDLFRNGEVGDEYNGIFVIPREKNNFFVVASNGDGWEHVSMHLINNAGKHLDRTPKWSEMCDLKDLFFEKDETVVQYHPAEKDYVNEHEYTLHLWRPLDKELPIPPSYMVGKIKKYNNQ